MYLILRTQQLLLRNGGLGRAQTAMLIRLSSVLTFLQSLMGRWKWGGREGEGGKHQGGSGGWPVGGPRDNSGSLKLTDLTEVSLNAPFDLILSCLPRGSEFTPQAISAHY